MQHIVNKDLAKQVREIFAEVTRYPIDILEDNAHFEEDLGIDSVKLAEVFAVIQEKLNLPEKNSLYEEQFSDIQQVVIAISKYYSPTKKASQVATPKEAEQVKPQPQINANKILQGKIVLVTGSGRGIGKVIAKHLANLGAFTIVNTFHSRNLGEELVDEINNEGGQAYHLWGSMANCNQIKKMFEEIETNIGGLDFLVSNASNGTLGTVESIQEKHWQKAYRTNVIGFHQAAIEASRLMKKRGGGRIVALSSPGARGYIEHLACIGTVKAAVESLVQYMASEFAQDNIAVNCVSPGAVEGNLIHKFPNSEQLVPHWKSLTPGYELCSPQHIAEFIGFLLGPNSTGMNGSIVDMDGGSSVYSYTLKERFQ
ncbi:SDR family oxidoreductase [Candidatus Uabimicrobium helgolandensis]